MTPPVREGVPLAPLTTLGVGGPARFLAEARSVDDLAALSAWARRRAVPLVLLGGGSNVVVADRGLDALVVAVRLRGIVWGPGEAVTVGAGENWDDFVAAAVARGWAGLECLSGIPGSVGATPIQNVGAYGQEVAETIAAVDIWNGAARTLTNPECAFGYRASAFQRERAADVVTAVRYDLRPDGAATLRYPELQRRVGAAKTLRGVRDAVLALRREKSMVLAADDPDSRSVGSFFKNPVVSAAQVESIARAAGAPPPQFAAPSGLKVPAAWLIERAGFTRGFRLRPGPVGLSRRHVLAIVNYGGGTAAQVMELAQAIRTAVADRFALELEMEPRPLGFEPSRKTS